MEVNAPLDPLKLRKSRPLIKRRERRPVSMRGFAARQDGMVVEIVVLDLSYDGCCIEVPAELVSGETIKFSVLSRDAIEAEVRWCSAGRAGLLFKGASGGDDLPRPRKEDRISLTAEVTTRRLGRPKYQARALDVSLEGCKIELVDRPRIGERMYVKFRLLEALGAKVCWIEGPQAGLRFEKPIHPAVFQLLLEHLRR